MSIGVSKGGHFFERGDGTPFFYLADTAWLLFNKLREEEIRDYFSDRAKKGFTVVQAVVFRDLHTPNTANAYGIRPFRTDEDMHAVRMNPEWIAYVARVVEIAREYDLVMTLLPTWGDKWNARSNSAGPVIMDKHSGRAYCRTLAEALKGHSNVIWALGGDSPVEEQGHIDIIRAMAEGLIEGGDRPHLITFYPRGIGTSAIFHSEDWLDFNALQSSHFKPNTPGYLYIERMFWEQPTKPCLDMEANYELMGLLTFGESSGEQIRHTSHLPYLPKFSAYDVRKSYYRTVLAGAAGFGYGCEPIRQVHRKGDRIHIWEDEQMPEWREGLSAPGSSQLSLLPRILLERSYSTRIPAQELFLPFRQFGAWPDRMSVGIDSVGQSNTDPASRISIARCSEGSYILCYIPVRNFVTIDASLIPTKECRISIFDPENLALLHSYKQGTARPIKIVPERDLDTFIVIDQI